MTLRVCLVNLTLNRSDNLYIVAWVSSDGHVQWSRLKFPSFSCNPRKVLAFVARGFVWRAGKQAKIKWVKNKIVSHSSLPKSPRDFTAVTRRSLTLFARPNKFAMLRRLEKERLTTVYNLWGAIHQRFTSPEVQRFTLLCTPFWGKKVPLSYIFSWKMTFLSYIPS